MNINEMTRKQFEELKTLNCLDRVRIDSLVLLPTRYRDSSGYNLFDIIACHRFQPIGKIGRYDTHSIIMESDWNKVGIDCLRKSSLMRIFLPDEYEIDIAFHTTQKIKGE